MGLSMVKIPWIKAFIYYPFLFFCMFPFILGNPFAPSDIQPYALILAFIVCIINISLPTECREYDKYFWPSLFLFVIATAVFLLSDFSVSAIRGFFNYCSVFFIPLALIYVFKDLKGIPENFLKICVLIWFVVGAVQLFISRGFATEFIANARWKDINRGVVGLASEPSFYGIACFYMLHLAQYFKQRKYFYYGLILMMGCIYAQSSLGIIFIAFFWVFEVLDQLPRKKGIWMLSVTVIIIFVFMYYLMTHLSGTRVYQLLISFISEGTGGLEDDASVEIRYNTLYGAIEEAFSNYLVPIGFRGRIGSAYGGFLCELGFFALPFLVSLSYMMSLTFHSRAIRFMYFFAFTMLMLNNTQMGNPLLLLVVATNAYYYEQTVNRATLLFKKGF